MADALVSALVTEVVGKLTNVALEEFKLLWGLEDDVSALKAIFSLVQAVLRDAEAKRNSEAVTDWLKRLKYASLEVENLLDEISTQHMLQRLRVQTGGEETRRGCHGLKASFSSYYNRLLVRTRTAHKVKTIRRKLEAIDANKSKFDLTPSSVSVDVGDEMRSRETNSLVLKSEIYGRNEEMEMVTQTICKEDIVTHDVDDVWVYAIRGMGGMGKTTLAKLVYNHESVKTHFGLKCWVYVSNEFDVMKLTRKIIESIDGKPCEIPQLDPMLVGLQDKLRGKRFLIVLDDVWNEDWTKWEDLRRALCCGAQGSIVMVTTRSEEISTMMAKHPQFQHAVARLSDEDSWLLFKKFAIGSGGIAKELEPIGKEIVEKCKGLPLAVKALGGLMSSKKRVDEWQLVKNSKIWELPKDEILPALKLSYDDLRPHLKQCFAYCCLFPKGHEMRKDELIELWMANGFIPSRGEVDLYALGEEVFNSLVWRSFFVDVQFVFGKMLMNDQTCKMHDLMHDLARNVMGHDCAFIELGNDSISSDEVEVLHLSSTWKGFLFHDQDLKILKKLRSLRSILMLGEDTARYISQISGPTYLRVLHLGGTEMGTFLESVCELKHLRYLNMSSSDITVVPESIMYLQNLQVLILDYCWKLHKLAKGMRFMRNLRHLGISECDELRHMPVGIKELVGLQRLSKFVVSKENGARIGELGDLNLLGWELELSGLENVGGIGDAESANLKNKTKLISLVLKWDTCARVEGDDEEVLEGLEPNSSLKRLGIRGHMGKKISPSWMVKLANLVEISIRHCRGCECIPALGKLPNLSSIKMLDMGSLKCFHDDDDNDNLFPSLRELETCWCPCLVSLPSNLPKLESLSIQCCNQIASLPDELLPSLKELWIMDCEKLRTRYEKEIGEDWPKISHIPLIEVLRGPFTFDDTC